MAVLAGCHLSERRETCASIDGATGVEVVSQGPTPDRVITDQERIRQLIAFANARREVSRPSLSTMPAPQESAIFYEGSDFVASIGAGQDFFFVSCANWKGIRKATYAEIAEFRRLIDSETAP
jgi:hypothetical protein